MNGYDRNFDFLDFLVNQQQEARRLAGSKGNNIAIYQYLGINDAMEIADGGIIIAQAHVGVYDTDRYNYCIYG